MAPANPSIATGNQQQFTATGTYSDGSLQNLTNFVTWTSTTPGVATIHHTGLATGVNTGTTTIQATSGAINGSTGLTVTTGITLHVDYRDSGQSIDFGGISAAVRRDRQLQ